MNIQFNLKPHWHSRKDYKHVFGSALPFTPLVFLSPLLVQNHNKCTAYSSCAIRASMKGKDYDPERQWEAEVAIYGAQGNDGVDLRTAAATGVKTGWYPVGEPLPTDKASAYFWVSPTKSLFNSTGLDMFDACRTAIQQIQAPLSAGMLWDNSWTYAQDGIIPTNFSSPLGYHDIKIAGYTTLNGIDYLVLQGSWGDSVGDSGKHYMSREVANKVLTQGVFYFSDDQNTQIKTLGLYNALLANLYNLLYRLAYGLGFTQ